MSHYSFKTHDCFFHFFFFFRLLRLPVMEKLASFELGLCHTSGKTPQLPKWSIRGFRNNKSTTEPQHQSRKPWTDSEVTWFRVHLLKHAALRRRSHDKVLNISYLFIDRCAQARSCLSHSRYMMSDNKEAFISQPSLLALNFCLT